MLSLSENYRWIIRNYICPQGICFVFEHQSIFKLPVKDLVHQMKVSWGRKDTFIHSFKTSGNSDTSNI